MPKKEYEFTPPKLTLGEVYYILFRHRWKILIPAIVGLVAGITLYLNTPLVYRSWAKLLVRYVRDVQELEPGSEHARVLSPDERGHNIINSEVEILTSPGLAEQTVSDLGVARFLPDGEEGAPVHEAASAILRNLHVEVPRRSNIIKLYFDGPNPELAQEVLGGLIDNYLQKHLEIHSSASSNGKLAQQTDQMRALLSRTEQELRELKKKAGIVSIEESRALIATRLASLTTLLQEAEVSLEAARAELKVMQDYPGARVRPNSGAEGETTEPQIGEAPRTSYTTLTEWRDRERELLSTYTADSIPVQHIRRQIAQLEQTLRMRELLTSGTNRDSISAEVRAGGPVDNVTRVVSLEARAKSLKQHLEEVQEQATKLDDAEGRIIELQRKRDMQETSYLYFSRSLEKARIDDAFSTDDVSNIKIAQAATFPTSAWRPNARRNMALVFGLCALFGMGLAFASEYYLDHTIKRPSEVEAFVQLPVLASVPLSSAVRHSSSRRRRKQRIQLLTTDRGKTDSGGVRSWDLHEELGPYVSTLRDRVIKHLAPTGKKPHLIGITGCNQGAGVSTLAAGLAITMANSGDGRVLLVDAHVGPLADNRVFGSTPTSGVVDISTEGRESTSIVQPNLFFLSTQESDEETAQISVLQGFTELVRFLAESQYDFVIFDMPPVSETSLAPRVAGSMETILLVIQAEKVRREVARRAKDLLLRANGNLLGAVLNMRHFYVPEWLYSRY